jgi:integrase
MKTIWTVTIGNSKEKSFVNIYLNGKRFRFWNGKAIGVKLDAVDNVELLKNAFQLKLLEGWRPKPRVIKIKPRVKAITFTESLEMKLSDFQKQDYSFHYKRDCKWVLSQWLQFSSDRKLSKLTIEEIKKEDIEDFIMQPKWKAKTQRNVLINFKTLTRGLKVEGLSGIKIRKGKSELHKPIRDVKLLLEDIKAYNRNLYLTCLLTYGCLLRPHQELRLLSWDDIDLERGIISLSGKRNKSGKNRIVPIPTYVRDALQKENKGEGINLLSQSIKPFNRDYLSVLWGRYKKQTTVLRAGVTLYSFRHTGAIKVFEKTGSLLKLQQVMGHSDMKVSLTYLRGLEVKQLDVEDLPEL